ncbi:MAG: hypothetical protein ACYC1Z_05400 [Georgenia sp.]
MPHRSLISDPRLTLDDKAFETIMAIARGKLVDVPVAAKILHAWTTPW